MSTKSDGLSYFLDEAMDQSSVPEIDGGLTDLEEFLLTDPTASDRNSSPVVQHVSPDGLSSQGEVCNPNIESESLTNTLISSKMSETNQLYQDISITSVCHANSSNGSHCNGNVPSPSSTGLTFNDYLKSNSFQVCLNDELDTEEGLNSVAANQLVSSSSRTEILASESGANDVCRQPYDSANEIQEEWANNMDTIFKNSSQVIVRPNQDNEKLIQKPKVAQSEERMCEEIAENGSATREDSSKSVHNKKSIIITETEPCPSEKTEDDKMKQDDTPQNIYDVLRIISMDNDFESTESSAGLSRNSDERGMIEMPALSVPSVCENNEDQSALSPEICEKNYSSSLDNENLCSGKSVEKNDKIDSEIKSDKSSFASHERDSGLHPIICDDTKIQSTSETDNFIDNKLLGDAKKVNCSEMTEPSQVTDIMKEDKDIEIKLDANKQIDVHQDFLTPSQSDVRSDSDKGNTDEEKASCSTDDMIWKRRKTFVTANKLILHEIPSKTPMLHRTQKNLGGMKNKHVKCKSKKFSEACTSTLKRLTLKNKTGKSFVNDADSNVTINNFTAAAMNLLSLRVKLEKCSILPGDVVSASDFTGKGKSFGRNSKKDTVIGKKKRKTEGRSSPANANKRRKLTKPSSSSKREVRKLTDDKQLERQCIVRLSAEAATVNARKNKLRHPRGKTDTAARNSLKTGKGSLKEKISHSKVNQDKDVQCNRIQRKIASNSVCRTRVKHKSFQSSKIVKRRSSSEMWSEMCDGKPAPMVVNLRSFDRGRSLRSRDRSGTSHLANETVKIPAQDLKHSNQSKRKSQDNKKIKPVPESPPHNPTIPVVELDRDADGEYESFNLGVELGLKPEPDLSPDPVVPRKMGRSRRKKKKSTPHRQTSKKLPSKQNLNKDCDLTHSCCQKNMALKVDSSTQWEDPAHLYSAKNMSPIVDLGKIPAIGSLQNYKSDQQEVQTSSKNLYAYSLFKNQKFQREQPAQSTPYFQQMEIFRKLENYQSSQNLLKSNANSTALTFLNVTSTQQAVIILPEEQTNQASIFHQNASSLQSTNKCKQVKGGNKILYQCLPEETNILSHGAGTHAASFGINRQGISNIVDSRKNQDNMGAGATSTINKSQSGDVIGKNDSILNNLLRGKSAEDKTFTNDDVIIQGSDSEPDVVYIG